MLKRLIMLLALGAALVACSPAGGSSADPVTDPSLDVPTESVGTESASPSAS